MNEENKNQSNELNNKLPDNQPINNVAQTPLQSQNNNEVIVNPNQISSSIDPGTTINTQKNKSNNFLVIIILLILVLGVIFIDDILKIFKKDPGAKIVGGNSEIDNNTELDTIDGMIVIDTNKGYVKKEFIKFYNFKKEENNIIKLDYVSDKEYDSVSKKELYIEIYDENKALLYKELFDVRSGIKKDAVLNYNINVDAYIHEKAKYGKIIIYSDAEKNQESSLICTFIVNNANVNINYKITYNYMNNVLQNYDVIKEFIVKEDEESLKYSEEVKNEYLDISKYNIKSDYTDKKLSYSIDLNELNGFTPIYDKKSTKAVVSAKEALKNWNCK